MACHVASSARVDSRAFLDDEADIGPGCVVGPLVRIGRGTRLSSHVCLLGNVEIGEFNTVGPFVAIGGDPQDLSSPGASTRVRIGDHNMIAERVTIHRGTEKDDGLTQIGNHNRFKSGVHVAHDCKIANRISVGIGSMLAGHVHIESDVLISESVGIHQFVTVGRGSFIGRHSKITQDVPCYMRVAGNPPDIRGINARQLQKKGWSKSSRDALREAHRMIFTKRVNVGEAATVLDDQDLLTPGVLTLIEFLESQRDGRMGRARGAKKE